MSHVPHLDQEIEQASQRLDDLLVRRQRAEERSTRPRRPARPRQPEVMTLDDYRRLWTAARSLRDTEGWRHRIECRVRQLGDSQDAA